MRKHMTRIAALVLSAGLAYGAAGTGAWFTSTDESPNNTIKSGTLDIDMRANGGRFGSEPQSIAWMAPGVETPWAITESVNIFNTVDDPVDPLNPTQLPGPGLDAKYRLTAPYVSGALDLYNLMNVEVRDQYFVAGDPAAKCGEAGALLYSGRLSSLNIMNKTGEGHGMLPAGNSHKFCLQFELDETAGNDVQATTVDFKFVASATQTNAPDPS